MHPPGRFRGQADDTSAALMPLFRRESKALEFECAAVFGDDANDVL